MMIIIQLFLSFLKIGFLGFGGGYAMLSMIIEDSLNMGLSIAQMADLNALDMLIPGPIAINAATYVGYLVGGFWGSLSASIAVSIPSFVFVYLFLYLEESMRDGTVIRTLIAGVKIAVVGIIPGSGFMLFKELLLSNLNVSWFISLALIICLYFQIKKDTNPIILTIICGIAGYLLYYII